MNFLDFILLGIILLFGVLGFRRGFLQTLGGIIGIIIASIVASRFYLVLGNLFGGSNFAKVIAFIIIFALVIKIISLFFWAMGKVFRLIAVIPFLQSFEHALGAVLGVAEGILVLSVVVFFFSKYPFNDWLMIQMKHSFMSNVLLTISYIFMPLFPEAVNKIKGII